MGRTSGPVDALREATGSFFQQASRTAFRIVRTNGKLELRWLARKQDLPFFIGSGRMGRSYAFLEDGYMYEAPVGYYSNRRVWDSAMSTTGLQTSRVQLHRSAYSAMPAAPAQSRER
jgi:hypothetical protein